MKMPKVITFDAGFTLINPERKRVAAVINRHFKTEFAVDELKRAEVRMRLNREPSYIEQLRRFPFCWNTLSFCGSLVCELIEDPFASQENFQAYIKECEPTLDSWFVELEDGAIQCMDMLKSAGFRLGLISNANGKVFHNMEVTGLDRYLEFVVDSGQVGFEKPDLRIFQHTHQLAKIQPHEMLHFGDSVFADVEGAINAGSQAALYDPTGDFIHLKPASVPHYSSLVKFAKSLCP